MKPSPTSLELDDGTLWLGRPVRKLQPLDPARAEIELQALAEAAQEQNLTRFQAVLAGTGELRAFLGAIIELSPYMRDSALLLPQSLEALFDEQLGPRLDSLNKEIKAAACAEGASEASVMKALRRLKREAHFLIGLGCLAGESKAAETVSRLSRLADACVQAAIDFLLLDAHRQGKLTLPDTHDPARE